MNILVKDKSNNELIAECQVENLLVNGKSIEEIPRETNILQLQNQKAIDCLKDVLEKGYNLNQKEWFDYVCNKIKELEGELNEF